MEEIGKILVGTYQIVEKIGSGGGGITYKGRHLRLGADIVVKKVRKEIVGKIDVDAEAKILTGLKHSYLPKIYDFIADGDNVYTVIDYIPGENIEEAVKKQGPFDEKRVLKWTNQLAEALAYLHNSNPRIIHSDIKPANIMLTNEDNICLIDFNISLALGVDKKSAVGVSLGFSPPEQFGDISFYSDIVSNYSLNKNHECIQTNTENEITRMDLSRCVDTDETVTDQELTNYDGGDYHRNDNRKAGRTSAPANKKNTKRTINDKDYTVHIGRGVDARSDIYSLGMSILYMLSGIMPSADYGNRADLTVFFENIQEGFAAIIGKMICFNPDDRYRDGAALLDSLRNIYKLDRRYKNAHRLRQILGWSCVVTFVVGTLFMAYGVLYQKNEDNSLYNKYLDDAEVCISNGDYTEAEDLINQAFEIDDTNGEAYREKILLEYSSGNYDNAIDEGIKYINSPTFEIWINSKYEELSNKEQSIGDIYYLIGNAYFEKEDYSAAVEYFYDAISYNDANGLYYRDLALALSIMGQNDKAMEQLGKAESLGISDDSMKLIEGQIASAKGEYDIAVLKYNECMSNTTSDQIAKRAILMCSEAYSKAGDAYLDENIAMLEKNKDRFGQQSGLLIKEYLAKAYMQKGMDSVDYNKKAIDVFEEIVSSGYATFQIEENIAVIYTNIGETVKAKEKLKELSDKYPDHYEIYKDLAYVEILTQKEFEISDRDYREFQKYYEQAVSLCNKPDDEMEVLKRTAQDLIDNGWEIY